MNAQDIYSDCKWKKYPDSTWSWSEYRAPTGPQRVEMNFTAILYPYQPIALCDYLIT